jgi:hypothetical protein
MRRRADPRNLSASEPQRTEFVARVLDWSLDCFVNEPAVSSGSSRSSAPGRVPLNSLQIENFRANQEVPEEGLEPRVADYDEAVDGKVGGLPVGRVWGLDPADLARQRGVRWLFDLAVAGHAVLSQQAVVVVPVVDADLGLPQQFAGLGASLAIAIPALPAEMLASFGWFPSVGVDRGWCRNPILVTSPLQSDIARLVGRLVVEREADVRDQPERRCRSLTRPSRSLPGAAVSSA